MPRLTLTKHLDRYLAWTPHDVSGATVAAVLEAAFQELPPLRSYLVDDQGRLRTHVMVFIDGEPIGDRAALSDAVGADQEIFVMQALSGG